MLAGGDALSKYQFASKRDEHFFCTHCGVRSFGTGDSPRWGKFYSVNVTCLDDVSDGELADAPITYLNGRDDDWEKPPLEVRHL